MLFLLQTYSIHNGPDFHYYLIPRRDGGIIVASAKPCSWYDRSRWYGVADDSKLTELAMPHFDKLMQRRSMGWEDSCQMPCKTGYCEGCDSEQGAKPKRVSRGHCRRQQ